MPILITQVLTNDLGMTSSHQLFRLALSADQALDLKTGWDTVQKILTLTPWVGDTTIMGNRLDSLVQCMASLDSAHTNYTSDQWDLRLTRLLHPRKSAQVEVP